MRDTLKAKISLFLFYLADKYGTQYILVRIGSVTNHNLFILFFFRERNKSDSLRCFSFISQP